MGISRDSVRALGGWKLAAFMTIWPGMDILGFGKPKIINPDAGPRFVRGLLSLYLGLALAFGIALSFPYLNPEVIGWLGIAALLITIHFGVAEILSSLAGLLGLQIGPLFDRPLASRSLADFWTARWNKPFVEMDRQLFLRPMAKLFGMKTAVFGVFMISGFLHEMAISYPAGGGYGGPMLYFMIQGALVLLERKMKLQSRVLTWIVVLAPLPLLFHSAFRSAFILPLFHWIHELLISHSLSWYFDKGLWGIGIMQLLVLMASFQVPGRLRWREELPRLSTFNRKLMWTNGAFIVLTIISFGVLTLTLHASFMRFEQAAIGLSTFITVFWTMRLLVDCVFYKHEDWPSGPQFVIGHALLDSLFSLLVLGYGSYVVWAIYGR